MKYLPMNHYSSPLLGERAAAASQQHTLQSTSVEDDKKSVLQLRGLQSAVTEPGYTQGFAQENQVLRVPFTNHISCIFQA